jgi:hypothetical protein
MAIYKIFPEKSATLYSYYPTTNTGLDEIIELSTFATIDGTSEVSRGVIKFPTNQISESLSTKVGNKAFDVYLKLYLANASSLPLDYTLFAHPLSGSWDMGSGKLGNVPITTDGASWKYKSSLLAGTTWYTAGSYPTNTTASYRSGGNVGGGLWYTSSNFQATQSFTNLTSKDIELKVTNVVRAWYSGSTGTYNTSSIINDGFILKHSSSLEFNPSASAFELKYFSGNTHTIYPPCLEIRWDDSLYVTGSLPIVSASTYVVSLGNNKGEYQQDSIQRFRVNVREKYPTRVFQTTSLYLNNKALPSSSYWSIKDLDTEEIVVDYDTSYTKISCDSSGNYFDIYMNGLEPERYYKLLFKSVLSSGETIVSDSDYYFKVIR